MVKLHFALVRADNADNIVEKVIDSHGKIVAGATVVLVYSTGIFEVENGRYPYLNRPRTTNAKGYLRFTPHKGPYRLLILSHDGYADLKQNQLPKSRVIRLTPWAGIIGRVLVGGKPPVTHRRVTADWIDVASASSKYPEIMICSRTLSNANGDFIFKRIPAGNVTLSWNSSGTPVRIKPGALLQVNLNLRPGADRKP